MNQFTAGIVPSAAAIAQLTCKVSDFLQEAGVDARAVHHVGLVIDEILTNLATHGGNNFAQATVVIDVHADHIAAEIADHGRPFDPRVPASVDPEAPAEEREFGGLGLHLVQQLTSALHYRHDGDRNRTTFCIARTQERKKG